MMGGVSVPPASVSEALTLVDRIVSNADSVKQQIIDLNAAKEAHDQALAAALSEQAKAKEATDQANELLSKVTKQAEEKAAQWAAKEQELVDREKALQKTTLETHVLLDAASTDLDRRADDVQDRHEKLVKATSALDARAAELTEKEEALSAAYGQLTADRAEVEKLKSEYEDKLAKLKALVG